MSNIDLSLDELIKQNKEKQNGQSGSKKSRGGQSRRGAPQNRPRDGQHRRHNRQNPGRDFLGGVQKREVRPYRANVQSAAGKLQTGNGRPNNGLTTAIVSNLAPSVSENDLTELFSEFGGFISAALHFDKNGQSMCIADLKFGARQDAILAIRKYDRVPLDDFPMNIRIAEGTYATTPRIPAFVRNAPVAQPTFKKGSPREDFPASSSSKNFRKETVVSATELDSDLDAYMAHSKPKQTSLDKDLDAYMAQRKPKQKEEILDNQMDLDF